MPEYFDNSITELFKTFANEEIIQLLNLETSFYKLNNPLKLESEIFKIFKDLKKTEFVVSNLKNILNVKEDEFLNQELKKVLNIKELKCIGCINLDCLDCNNSKIKYKEFNSKVKYNYSNVKIFKKECKSEYIPEIKETILISHIEHKLKSIDINTSKIIIYPIGFDIKYSVIILISKDIYNFTIICDDELICNFLEKNKIQVYKSNKAKKIELKKNILLINIKDEYIFLLCKNKTVFLFYEQISNLFNFSKYFNVEIKDIYLFKNSFYDIEFISSIENEEVFIENGSVNLGYTYEKGTSEILDQKLIHKIQELNENIIIYSFSKSIISLIFKELLKNDEINLDDVKNLTKENSNYYKFGLGVYNRNAPEKDLILNLFNIGKIKILISDTQINTKSNVQIFYDFEIKDSIFKERNKNQKVIFLCKEILKVNKLELKSTLIQIINSFIQRKNCKVSDIYNFLENSFSNFSQKEINFCLKRLISYDLIKYGNKIFIGTNKGRLTESFSIKEENLEIFFNTKFYSQADIFEVLNQTEEIKKLQLKPIKQTINLNKPQNNRILNEFEKDFFLDLPIPTHKHSLIYEFNQLIQNKKSKLSQIIISLMKTIFYILIDQKNTVAIENARLLNFFNRKNVKIKINKEDLTVSGSGEVDLFLVDYNNDEILEYKKVELSRNKIITFRRNGICVVVYNNNCEMFECFSE